jgi:methyl-accepting chemotaxis protein
VLSVARRAAVGFVAMLGFSLTASGFVFAMSHQSSGALALYTHRTAVLNDEVSAMASDFYNYDDQMNMYVAVLAGAPHQHQLAEVTYEQAVAAGQALGHDLAEARVLAPGARTQALLARAEHDYVAYNGFAGQTRAAGLRGDISRALYLQTVGNLVPSNDIMPALQAISAVVKAQARQTLASLQRRQNLVQSLTIVSVLVTTMLVVALGLLLRLYALGPLTRLRDGMTAMAAGGGQRGERIEVERHDEIGEVAEAFNRVLGSLDQREADLAVANAQREEHMQANFTLQREAQAALRQRAQEMIDHTASTVTQELSDVRHQVEAVRAAATTIDRRVAAADSLTRAVVGQAGEAEVVVEGLGESLRQVANMATLIASVSEQTKLLALNATIEAARAGTAGKGFNVVASEVKELALTTAGATDRIAATVATIEKGAQAVTEVITAMTAAISGVDESTAALAQVATDQHQLVERLDRTLSETIERLTNMSSLTDELERREHPRMAAIGPVTLLTRAGHRLTGELVDISEGGLHCAMPVTGSLPPDATEAEFSFFGYQAREQVRIVRQDSTNRRLRLQFVAPSAELVARVRARVEGGLQSELVRR